ncbi:hypothetical protein [Williamsia sp. 1135]|uniref:hypothetical protein n=1 Tax=Williamsia sp. 1135 TaxID=1889262 RepID=UPI000A100F6A|nr:hypothetical protein [Williamsia sp. 1135]ORM37408.1 hypothetical protein BFL43_04430 [Williamsia sp. 1135]
MPAAQPGSELRIDGAAVLAAARDLEPVLVELAAISSDIDELARQIASTCAAHVSGHVFARAHGRLSAGAVAAVDEAHASLARYAGGLTRAVEVVVNEDAEAAGSVPAASDH